MAFSTMNIHRIKQEICEIGRRVYQRGFAAANDGNITYRISENEVLCTPTMICKGFMQPADICSVDMQGNQLSGTRKRTSEVLLHLAIMRERPDVKACVHCHPPHATAFAVAREPIPQCVLPEVEVFLGDVPITRYETPGGQAFADTVLPFVNKTNVIILANHGTVSYGETLEKAYWWTEILDAYCRILLLAKQLGNITYFTPQQTKELLDLKRRLGFSDARIDLGLENCDLCSNDVFRGTWAETGVARRAFPAPTCPTANGDGRPAVSTIPESLSAASAETAGSGESPPAAAHTNGLDEEALVQAITDRVLAALAGR